MKTRRLKPGELAPSFTASDWQGQVVDLGSLRGDAILLSFFRYASCPLCNPRIQELLREHERLMRNGVSVLSVFQPPAERLTHYVGRQAPPFPIIPDPQLKLYRMYRGESSWVEFLRAWTIGFPNIIYAVIGKNFLPGMVENDLHRIPADFLIGPDGMLIDVYYGVDNGDHIPLRRVLDSLEKKVSFQQTRGIY
jgi:peroxiredoxin Q/BCP